MASYDAKVRMMDRELKRLELNAKDLGNADEVERFRSQVTQNVNGDGELKTIFILRAANDLIENANGIERSDEELSEDEKILKYSAQDDDMVEAIPSYEKGNASTQGQSYPEGAGPGDSLDDVEEPSGSEEEDSEEPDATPAAERRADELGVDLNEVEGSGDGGKILVSDVEAAASEADSEEDSE